MQFCVLSAPLILKGDKIMTALTYIRESKIATVQEILAFKKADPGGFETLVEMAKSEMHSRGIPVESPAPAALAA